MNQERRVCRAVLPATLLLVTSLCLAGDEEPDQVAWHAEDEAVELDRIRVTGTRLRGIDTAGPLPLTVFDREDLETSGRTTLSDWLRDLPFNSFGTPAGLESPLTTVPGHRVLSLRGLGPGYTLVLLDGQRLPGFSGSDGASTSIAGLPMAAIARVEVLRDGASAVYGSEAIGGVINIITRRGDAQRTVGAQFDYPTEGGGRMATADLVLGGDYGNGDWLVTIELNTRDPLSATQRPYLVENAPLSSSGAPGSFLRFHPQFGMPVGLPEADVRCPSEPGVDPIFPSSGRQAMPGGEICGYRFRDDAFERQGVDSGSLFGSLRHALRPNLMLEGRMMLWRVEGKSQLAPSPANLMISSTNPFNPTIGEFGPDQGFNLAVLYRLTPLGPRISESQADNLHAAVQILGNRGRFDWQAGIHHNYQDFDVRGTSGYALTSTFQQIVARGAFDPFTALPGEPGVLAEALTEPRQRGRWESTGLEASLGFDVLDLRAGAMEAALGATLRQDQFRARFDEESQRGNVIGSPGGAEVDAKRDHAAAYAELLVPMTSTVELNAAIRFDHYEQAGNAVSPKLALSWRAHEQLLLRAAAGRGFRVIDLRQAYAATQTSFGFAIDEARCAQEPQNPNACIPLPVEFQLPSNPALDPERARQEIIGLIVEPWTSASVGLDFYRIRIRDQVSRLTVEEVTLNDLTCLQEGRACDPLTEGAVSRDPFGNMQLITVPAVNISSVKTSGIDLELSQRFSAGPGRGLVGLNLSRVLEFERELRPDLPSDSRLGLFGSPRMRATAQLEYQLGVQSFNAAIRYIDGFRACPIRTIAGNQPNPLCEERLRSHTEIDLRWSMEFNWDGRLALGVRNLANREAPLTSEGELSYALHDVVGRVLYARYDQRF